MFKIPTQLLGLGGLVKVTRAKEVRLKGKKCAGKWEPWNREITLQDQDNREMKFTYYHEMFHAALHDSGMHQLLELNMEEALCDLVGMMMVREKEF